MLRKTTPSFILELALETSLHDETILNARFEAARQLYNACLDYTIRRLDLLHQSKEYQQVRSMPRTENGKPNKVRTEAFKALNAKFGFSEYDLHLYVTKIRKSFIGNHLDSTTAQKLATRAFKAVQRIAFGLSKRVRFKGKNQLKSVEGKSNKSGIRYKEAGYIEWNGLKLKCQIDVNDEVVIHGLSCPVKYCRIIKRIFNGKKRFFVQLILEGAPYQKFKASDKIVGLDIGPSTIAYVRKPHQRPEAGLMVRKPHQRPEAGLMVRKAHQRQRLMVSDAQAKLECFCDELKDKQKEIRRLQRKLERQRHANNPQNYNSDGTIKEGKKTWHYSKRYLKTRTKLAELQRKLATDPSQAQDKSLHGNLVNRILRQGKHIKTEKLSYRAFQKNYGKSVKDRAPGMFMEILRRKAENAGGSVIEFSTKEIKLSQYCHKCGKYIKKPLSQRVHTCCNLNIQRDLYSAFLAGSVVSPREINTLQHHCSKSYISRGENKLDTADVIKRWRSTPACAEGRQGSCSPAGGVRIKSSCEWKASAFQLWSFDPRQSNSPAKF